MKSLSNGHDAPNAVQPECLAPVIRSQDYVLIVGGAGFIGSNLAHRLMEQGRRVLVFDSLARAGVEQNLRWLQARHAGRLMVQIADIRDRRDVDDAVRHASAVYHLGAQVAVTTSILDPVEDFEINAAGTLNLLEALRGQGKRIPLLFTSTNKVYGDLQDVALAQDATRYYPADPSICAQGIDETRSLAFHSPYGCSKGAADQYALDYAHTYGMPATVFRMSCIYGVHQFGTEDQGWVAHFLRCALRGEPITIYGDGKQVRDLLFIDDLIDALQLAHEQIERTAGRAYNIGGGPDNAVSLLELLALIEQLQGAPVRYSFDSWRRGDQRYYVSNTHKFQQTTGWRAQVSVQEGLTKLYQWLLDLHAQDAGQLKELGTAAQPAAHYANGSSNASGANDAAPLPKRHGLPAQKERTYGD
ncbi:MAG: CDP-paratose 2-epimerase [Chloroflexi bacterium]|nr:MAG: CDP-paratose 2-epimerase [Chloroflexota bacterium]